MNIQGLELIRTFAKLSPTQDFNRILSGTGMQNCAISGLAGSSLSLAAAAHFAELSDPGVHLFIFEERDEAGYFFNDLQQLFKGISSLDPEKQIQLYTTSFKLSIRYEQTDTDH